MAQSSFILLATIVLVAAAAITVIVLDTTHTASPSQSLTGNVVAATSPDALADMPGCGAYCGQTCIVTCS